MKRIYHNLIILFSSVAVLISCQKEPCQKCLEAQGADGNDNIKVSATLIGEDYIAEGLTCPATLYVWNGKGFLSRFDSTDGQFSLSLPGGFYDFAVTVNVPTLSGAAVDDLRNSILTLSDTDGVFLFGITRNVEVFPSSVLSVPVIKSYPVHLNSKLF